MLYCRGCTQCVEGDLSSSLASFLLPASPRRELGVFCCCVEGAVAGLYCGECCIGVGRSAFGETGGFCEVMEVCDGRLVERVGKLDIWKDFWWGCLCGGGGAVSWEAFLNFHVFLEKYRI